MKAFVEAAEQELRTVEVLVPVMAVVWTRMRPFYWYAEEGALEAMKKTVEKETFHISKLDF